MGTKTLEGYEQFLARGGVLGDEDNEHYLALKRLAEDQLPGLHLQRNDKTGPILWSDCEDIEVYSDEQHLLYAGPRYLRCTRSECHALVTQGMVHKGGCWCGNRRLVVAFRLTTQEKAMLKRGYYPLLTWEASQIQPTCPEGKVPGWGKDEFLKRYA